MDQAKANRYAAQLGLTPQRLQALQSLPTFEEASRYLEELKKDVRTQYRKLVFQYHPDRNQGDPAASEILRDLGEVLRSIEALNIQPRAPQPVIQIHFVHMQQSPAQAHARTAPSYSTTSATQTTTYYAHRVAFVRPV